MDAGRRQASESMIIGSDQPFVRPLAVARCAPDRFIVRGETPVPGPFGTTLTTGRCNACRHLREVVDPVRADRLHAERVASRILPCSEPLDAMDDARRKLTVVGEV